MRRNYAEVKQDFYRLKDLCDGQEIPDYCGAWCNNDMMTMLLDNPTKTTAAYMFSSLISTYHSRGHAQHLDYEGPKPLDLMNSEVHEILVRNGDL